MSGVRETRRRRIRYTFERNALSRDIRPYVVVVRRTSKKRELEFGVPVRVAVGGAEGGAGAWRVGADTPRGVSVPGLSHTQHLRYNGKRP